MRASRCRCREKVRAMSVSKDPECGTFYIQCRHKDRTGERKKKTKRSFKTEKEARKWEYEFLKRMEGAPTMLFSEFYRVYAEDVKPRLRRNTWESKAHMIGTKILPHRGGKRVNEISSLDILTGRTSCSQCVPATGWNTRRPTSIRSATGSRPCSITPSATMASR